MLADLIFHHHERLRPCKQGSWDEVTGHDVVGLVEELVGVPNEQQLVSCDGTLLHIINVRSIGQTFNAPCHLYALALFVDVQRLFDHRIQIDLDTLAARQYTSKLRANSKYFSDLKAAKSYLSFTWVFLTQDKKNTYMHNSYDLNAFKSDKYCTKRPHKSDEERKA
jgi:hypothetical protein